jgi:hypothetical protein
MTLIRINVVIYIDGCPCTMRRMPPRREQEHHQCRHFSAFDKSTHRHPSGFIPVLHEK